MREPYGGVPPHEPDDTSSAAAAGVMPFVRSMEERVRRYVELSGRDGATCDEIEAGLGMLHQTASARVRTLVLKQELVKTTDRRRTRQGMRAAVYVAPAFALHRQAPLLAQA